MSVTVEVSPSVQATLQAEADGRSVSVSEIVRRLIDRAYPDEILSNAPRPSGRYAGKIIVPNDFDATLPNEILDAFEGE